jgi:hypothetical protein
MREVNPRGVSAPTAFERGIVRADPSTFGMFGERSNTNPFEQPEFGEIVEEDTLTERLMSMLGGIGQSELGSIWADPTVIEILQRNSIRMNPDAPYDIQQATGATAEGLSELSDVIQEIEDAGGYDNWVASQEDPPTPITDVVEGAVDTVTEGVVTTVQDALTAAQDALPDGATAQEILDWIAENVPEITPQSIFDEYIGAGVGVNLPTGAPIGSGTVFIPGIPGLPSSSPNMVIGTVEEVLEDILAGNLPGVIGDIAEDPVGGIQGVIGGAVDDAQEVTAGDLLGDVDLLLGDDEGIDSVFDEPGQRTDYGGGLNDGETEDILAGVGGAAASAGGGTTIQKPSGDFTPFMKRLDYRPVAIPEAVVPSLFREYFT